MCLIVLNNQNIPHFPYYMVKMPCFLHFSLKAYAMGSH